MGEFSVAVGSYSCGLAPAGICRYCIGCGWGCELFGLILGRRSGRAVGCGCRGISMIGGLLVGRSVTEGVLVLPLWDRDGDLLSFVLRVVGGGRRKRVGETERESECVVCFSKVVRAFEEG